MLTELIDSPAWTPVIALDIEDFNRDVLVESFNVIADS